VIVRLGNGTNERKGTAMKFYELAIGARFVFRGQRFEKIAISMARGLPGFGGIFMGETEVTPEAEALLLPPEEAAKWKPSDKHRTDYLTPAPGQRRAEGET